MKNYVITIARGYGSGGKEIAQKLSDRLGIPWYERQILTMASEESGIAEGLFPESDEKLVGHKFSMLLGSMPNKYVVDPNSPKFVKSDNLFHIQSELIKSLARTESCIIVGKAANMVLKDFDNVISVYIEAPRKACVESITRKLGISEKEAHKLISETDKYRYDYYKYYTHGKDWRDPVAYDMTINSDRVGRDKAVDLICQYRKIKFGEDA